MSNNPKHLMTNNISRPYDDFMSFDALKKALKLRLNPDGEVHKVTTTTRAGQTVAVYPWRKLLLGDMFFAPIGNKSVESMRISFSKAAARFDLEICVVRATDPKTLKTTGERDEHGRTIFSGVECLRVSVSAMDVGPAKKAAFEAGVIHQRPAVTTAEKAERALRDRTARAMTRKRHRAKAKAAKIQQANGGVIPGDKKTDPFWADSRGNRETVAPVESTLQEGYVTDASMSREEKVRLALRKA